MFTELKVDPEFSGKVLPLSVEEFQQLEENILADGVVLNPLITWNGIIVDGHNRYRVLLEHQEIPFQIHEKEFPDRFAVIAWICRNQLGRRNLTPQQRKYLVGKQYEAEKASHGGIRHKERDPDGRFTTSPQNDDLWTGCRTCEKIAREANKSKAYVERAEKYAVGIDAAEEILPGIKTDILSGKLRTNDKDITAIARASPEEREAMVRWLTDPVKEKKPTGRQAPQEDISDEGEGLETAVDGSGDEPVDDRTDGPAKRDSMVGAGDDDGDDAGDDDGDDVSDDAGNIDWDAVCDAVWDTKEDAGRDNTEGNGRDAGIKTGNAGGKKKTKAEELRKISSIYDSMLHPEGQDTMEDVLYQLNYAVEDMVLCWKFCLEAHEDLVRERNNRRQIWGVARKAIVILEGIAARLDPSGKDRGH